MQHRIPTDVLVKRMFMMGLLGGILILVVWWLWGIFGTPETRPGEGVEQPTGSSRQAQNAQPEESLSDSQETSLALQPVRLSPVQVLDGDTRAGWFSGQVLSWATGLGVEKAELTFTKDTASFSVTTSKEGRFQFEPPSPGTFQLAAVHAEGYLPYAPSWGYSPLVLQSAAGKNIEGVILYLQPAVEFQGRVEDPDGSMVVGAEVRLLAQQEALMPVPDRFRSDEKGEFRFVAKEGALLEARYPGFAPGRAVVDKKAQITRRVVLRLNPGNSPGQEDLQTIAGTVLDPEGFPLAEALVTAWTFSKGPLLSRAERSISTLSDSNGQFELADLEASLRYDLRASYSSLTPAAVGKVPAGTRGVVLRLSNAGGQITGEVKSKNRLLPIPAFTVFVSKRMGPLEESLVQSVSMFNPEGRYQVGALAPGEYQVRIAAHGFAPPPPVLAVVSPSAGSSARADFFLSSGGSIRGTVLDGRSNKPLPQVRISQEGLLASETLPVPVLSSAVSDEQGRFELRGIAPGMCSLTLMAVGYHQKIVSGLEIREGIDTRPLTVTLSLLDRGEEPKVELVGIGAVLSAQGPALIIGQVVAGGGAAEAGLMAGDSILKVEGAPLTELGFEGAVQRIRGVENTPVLLTVQRADGKVMDLEVYRRKIKT